MNVAPMVPAIIIGTIRRRFAKAGAYSETEAKSLDELGFRTRFRPDLSNSPLFRRLIRKGQISKTGDGRYYMSRTYYEALERRKKIVIPIVLGALVIVGVLALLFAK